MLKTLWSGLTGLQAHQQALDVESNNISNANTDGFKYSKVSFEDLVSQNLNSSTAPSENLGGINGKQIGLGVTVSSIEKIFSQGSLEATDRTTDLSLQGDGFFIVSDNNGDTNNYTRNGQFSFDSNGTLVNNNGLKVMGWEADMDNFTINNNNRLEGITIDPDLKIDAKATEEVSIKGNLNSGDEAKQTSAVSHPYSKYEHFNNLYNTGGEMMDLINGDTITINYTNVGGAPISINYSYDDDFTNMADIIDIINQQLTDPTGEVHSNRVYMDGEGRLTDSRGLIDTITSSNVKLNELFSPLTNGIQAEPLKIDPNNFFSTDDIQELFNSDGEKINIKNGEGVTFTVEGLKENRNFVYRDIDVSDLNDRRYDSGEFQLNADLELADKDQGFHWAKDVNGNVANLNVGDSITVNYQNPAVVGAVTQTLTFTYGIDFSTMDDLAEVITDALPSGSTSNLHVNEITGQIEKVGDFIQSISLNSVLDAGGLPLRNPVGAGNGLSNFFSVFSPIVAGNSTGSFYKNDTYYFSDTQSLENLIQMSIDQAGNPLVNIDAIDAEVSFNDRGQINVENTGSKTFGMSVSGYPDVGGGNDAFTNIMMGLNALSVPDNSLQSREMRAATHIITTDVFDSYGIKYPVDFNFKKSETINNDDKIVWDWKADISEPATFSGTTHGEVVFNADGSLYSYTPSTLTFVSNSGANANPTTFNLNFGKIGELDGLLSQNSYSRTDDIDQDGYTGGQLENVTIDKFGVVGGTFSNGINKSLAQIGLATFANNSGLESVGGNLYSSSSNSGEAEVTTALEPGVASIQSNSLEKSNVDLSKSLVSMIVFQRGFQANSKTISTADELLKELIGLKR